MTDYELAKQILYRMARYSAEIINYQWDAEFCKSNLLNSVEKLKQDVSYFPINPTKLTATEMADLGFGTWEDNGLFLIPLWLYHFLEEGFECTCISGEVLNFSFEETDNDHRFGMLSYQVKPMSKLNNEN